MKKVGKTTRPFRYDLNQIPYDYTVEVRNTFKGLDLIQCLMNYGMRFLTLYRRKEIQPVHSEGDQPWDFFGRNDAKAEAPILWPPHAKS